MLRIGLTGGIGSGKSTITKELCEKGLKVVDADLIAREVLDIYPEIKELIKINFGEQYFDNQGNLLRRELGELIFNDEIKRKELDGIILPFIIKEIFNRLDDLEEVGEKVAFVDAPLLIETNINKMMNYNILVWVDKETQIKRVMLRDDFSREAALSRIDSQMDLDEKKEYVDYIVDNSNSIEDTKNQLRNLLEEIGEKYE
ncbi:MAG: dephospho-CoA kinase [Clostridiaceae bacterium]